MSKFTQWSFRWPTPLHNIATKIARDNRRSLNEQVLFWLENGGMGDDMTRGIHEAEIYALKVRYTTLVDEACASVPGIKEAKLHEAETVRARLAEMGVAEARP